MKATRVRSSPHFRPLRGRNRHRDAIVRDVMAKRPADMTARMTTDNVLHEVWTIADSATIKAYQDALAGEDIFIADGSHRYNADQLPQAVGVPGPRAREPPARPGMMVLVGIGDPGLVILAHAPRARAA